MDYYSLVLLFIIIVIINILFRLFVCYLLLKQVYRKPMPIDPAIMSNVKMSGNIGYAKVPDGSARRFPYQLTEQGQSGAGIHRGGGGGGHHHHHHNKKSKGYVTM